MKLRELDDEVNSVLLMILSDLFDFILIGELFKEVLVVTSPLADGQLGNLQLITLSIFNDLKIPLAAKLREAVDTYSMVPASESFLQRVHHFIGLIFH